ncbi:ABC transporter ATP-binding protein [Enterovirga aerilata]|uniref:ABC transporter ATP-binding protein n=1 Tax=Enterovirga aerilata TaxID=2730920 RepID=A0A849I0A3_9HYPH|nr:ABC transporter ATP-binding protein [Enterovirga sp. DB1703]NNM73186.1 ABC transporter ATP-binding protein [Enterovirga sp. DB1703]
MAPAALPRRPPAYLRGPVAFILHYVRNWGWSFGAIFLFVIVAAGASIGIQYVLKVLVDIMAGPAEARVLVWTALAFFVGLIATESLSWRVVGWLTCRTTIGVGVDMRLDLFEYLNRQPMRYFAENLAGSLGQRITATAGNFGALANTLIWRVLPPCIDFAGALIIFSGINLGMMAALATVVVVVTTLLVVFGERGRPRHRHYSGLAGRVAGELVDTITNMWAVKAFSARQREHARLAQGFREEAAAQRRSWMHIETARLLNDVVLTLSAAGMLVWAVTLWSEGRITPGDVVVVSTLTFRILHSSRDLALSLVDLSQQFGFIDETLRKIAQPRTVVNAPDAATLVPRGGAVEFRGVSFSYGGPREVTHELSLTIPAGQKIGIVGPSGAGKSTLVNLLQRLWDVDDGEILVDGQPIADVTQDSLRAALAVVPQEIVLFHRSVMENIRFGRPDATDEEVVEAARAAHCDGFIRRLPEGYDTIVGERGAKLSGGQRQRIGIARAFLKDAPIIVLDEATSALDTESEIEIQRSLVQRMRGRTVIAVAHRLSTLASFDRVIVIQNGRIVEDGTPAELRRLNGVFQAMWRLQARGLSADEVVDEAA